MSPTIEGVHLNSVHLNCPEFRTCPIWTDDAVVSPCALVSRSTTTICDPLVRPVLVHLIVIGCPTTNVSPDLGDCTVMVAAVLTAVNPTARKLAMIIIVPLIRRMVFVMFFLRVLFFELIG